MAASSAAKTKDTYLAARYGRLVGRRGKKRANKAVGHPTLIAAFHILAGDVPYHDLGGDYFHKRTNPQRQARKHLNDLRAMRWTVTENAEGHITCSPPPAAA